MEYKTTSSPRTYAPMHSRVTANLEHNIKDGSNAERDWIGSGDQRRKRFDVPSPSQRRRCIHCNADRRSQAKPKPSHQFHIHRALALLHQLYLTVSSFNVASQLPLLLRLCVFIPIEFHFCFMLLFVELIGENVCYCGI
uniref:Uncharacterized protein n=1 Tax=Kalanchoe fedtschenkoi TaxID=63787 RepID=A0A7N0RBF0_KALFE